MHQGRGEESSSALRTGTSGSRGKSRARESKTVILPWRKVKSTREEEEEEEDNRSIPN
jgi:hypothetical protein